MDSTFRSLKSRAPLVVAKSEFGLQSEHHHQVTDDISSIYSARFRQSIKRAQRREKPAAKSELQLSQTSQAYSSPITAHRRLSNIPNHVNNIGITPEMYSKDEKVIVTKSFSVAESSKSSHSGIRKLLSDSAKYDCLIVSTSSSIFQGWKVLFTLLSFVSSFHYFLFASFEEQLLPERADRILPFIILYEVLFGLDLILNFFTEKQLPNGKYERDLFEIWKVYLTTTLVYDAIALLPLYTLLEVIFEEPQHPHLVYLIKVVRIYKAFYLLDHQSSMKIVKQRYFERMQKLIKQDPTLASDSTKDNNNITRILLISYFLKTVTLLSLILVFSFFFGLFWYGLSSHTRRYTGEGSQGNFIEDFDLNSQSEGDRVITLTYFAFTTFSTVGLGDLHPRSDVERLIGAFILLFGVAMTSYIMDHFNRMLRKFEDVNKDFDRNEKLSQFFSILKKFNDDLPVVEAVQSKIESYFQHRWHQNKDGIVSEAEDINLFQQLPATVAHQIYGDFLYKDFSDLYSYLFKGPPSANRKRDDYPSPRSPRPATQQTLLEQSNEAEQLKFRVMSFLEPIVFTQGTVIAGQKTKLNEVYFMMKGEVSIGYNFEYLLYKNDLLSAKSIRQAKMTKKTRVSLLESAMRSLNIKAENKKFIKFQFPQTIGAGTSFGLYETMFDQESSFVYKSKDAEMYFIRRFNWFKIEKEFSAKKSSLLEDLKKVVLKDYLNKIYLPIQNCQDEKLEAYQCEKRGEGSPSMFQNERKFGPARSRHSSIFDTWLNYNASRIEQTTEGEAQIHRKTQHYLRMISIKQDLRDQELKKFIEQYFYADNGNDSLDSSESGISFTELSMKCALKEMEKKLQVTERLIDHLCDQNLELKTKVNRYEAKFGPLNSNDNEDLWNPFQTVQSQFKAEKSELISMPAEGPQIWEWKDYDGPTRLNSCNPVKKQTLLDDDYGAVSCGNRAEKIIKLEQVDTMGNNSIKSPVKQRFSELVKSSSQFDNRAILSSSPNREVEIEKTYQARLNQLQVSSNASESAEVLEGEEDDLRLSEKQEAYASLRSARGAPSSGKIIQSSQKTSIKQDKTVLEEQTSSFLQIRSESSVAEKPPDADDESSDLFGAKLKLIKAISSNEEQEEKNLQVMNENSNKIPDHLSRSSSPRPTSTFFKLKDSLIPICSPVGDHLLDNVIEDGSPIAISSFKQPNAESSGEVGPLQMMKAPSALSSKPKIFSEFIQKTKSKSTYKKRRIRPSLKRSRSHMEIDGPPPEKGMKTVESSVGFVMRPISKPMGLMSNQGSFKFSLRGDMSSKAKKGNLMNSGGFSAFLSPQYSVTPKNALQRNMDPRLQRIFGN